MFKNEQEEMRALLKRKPKRKVLRLFEKEESEDGKDDVMRGEGGVGSHMFFARQRTDTFRSG